VTKFNAGGSGDNIIANGQIRAVEKVWLDNYTLTSNITLTNTTISVANLPEGAVVTDISVVVATSISQSSGTIGIGWASDADAASWGSIMSETDITHNRTVSTVSLYGGVDSNLILAGNNAVKIAGVQQAASGTRNTIAIKLNNWTMSTGTLKTMVRYTN
jgi:hypothetical protein